jgi:hypothetical protein
VENLAANFRDCFKPWDIENKIAVIVSDNAANVVPTVRVGAGVTWGALPTLSI